MRLDEGRPSIGVNAGCGKGKAVEAKGSDIVNNKKTQGGSGAFLMERGKGKARCDARRKVGRGHNKENHNVKSEEEEEERM